MLPPILNADGTENPFALLERDPVLYKKVVLCMALQRQPKEAKDEGESSPPVITEGFYWKDYPPCETVLYESMSEYYELSKQSRQSKEQQAFNNDLVRRIRATADQHGYSFDDAYFTDKRLRDRIRCFFKVCVGSAVTYYVCKLVALSRPFTYTLFYNIYRRRPTFRTAKNGL
jgi:hypothetical protein